MTRALRTALLAAAARPGLAAAQPAPWAPDRPLRIVIPVAPGGSLDILGRVLARHLTAR